MKNDAQNWQPYLEVSARSDIGLRRGNNQDAFAVRMASDEKQWATHGHLLVVADGMGAHAAGELASKMAADIIAHTYYKLSEQSASQALQQAVLEANRRIHERGQANIEFHGMGTTASVLALLPGGAIVAHAGDSRVYRLRRRRLEQLTFDHSLVWEMRASGQLRGDEVPGFVPKNIITRSLGPNEKVRVDLEGTFPLAAGDTFLLCSDGLSGQVTDQEMGVLLGCLPPEEAVQTLVDLANLRGGPDNITVIVAEVRQPWMQLAEQAEVPRRSSRAVRPPLALLIAPVLLLVLAGVLGLAGQLPLAVAAGLVAALLAVAAGIYSYSGGNCPSGCEASGPLGRAPYTACDCVADSAMVEQLETVLQELDEAAEEQNWKIDRHRFSELEQAARDAAQRQDYETAVREQAHAISFMMQQLRQGQGEAG